MHTPLPDGTPVTMRLPLDAFRPLPISLAGCLNQHQREVIDYLQEENRLLARFRW
jgi:hypothetical protein